MGYIHTDQHKPWYTSKLPHWLCFISLSFSISNCPFFPIFLFLIRYFQIFQLPHRTVIWSIVLPSTPSPSVSHLGLSFSFITWWEFRWIYSPADSEQIYRATVKQQSMQGWPKQLMQRSDVTDNYTYGLAYLSTILCIVRWQKASVAVFSVASRVMLNGSMSDKLESPGNLLQSQCWCTLYLCLSLTRVKKACVRIICLIICQSVKEVSSRLIKYFNSSRLETSINSKYYTDKIKSLQPFYSNGFVRLCGAYEHISMLTWSQHQ